MLKTRFNKKIAFSDNSNLRFSVVRRRFHIFSNHKKGVVLLIVLGTLLVVASLATVILSLILSHARLTHHQTSRIQANYAAMAGVNYAIEKLRLGNDANWPATGTYTHYLCRSGCSGSGDVNDSDLPSSIQRVEITVSSPGTGISGTRPISAKAIYTYTP